MTSFHPELKWIARLLPRSAVSPWLVWLAKAIQRWRGTPKPPVVEGVQVEDFNVPGPEGTAIRLRLYVPRERQGPVPVMLWIHGGGFVLGTPEQDEPNNIALVRDLGLAVAAVRYRLAPEHPFPAPLDDCYQALLWLHSAADKLGIDRSRIAIGGASAGGGLAAGLTLLAHDRKEVPVVAQLLIYPMLDDRSTLKPELASPHHRLWTLSSNVFGWTSYLGRKAGGEGISTYAAPSRREDSSGLPPAWIGVGTLDLFHNEDVAYARRLADSGVPCELQVVSGAFHAFDLLRPRSEVARHFRQSYVEFLKGTLLTGDEKPASLR